MNGWIQPSFSGDYSASLKNASKDSDGLGRIGRQARHDKTAVRKAKSDILWYEKYTPRAKEDLCVHRKKLEEIQCWLADNVISTDAATTSNRPVRPGLLVLTGPSGSGKTATLRLAASLMKIDIMEWINPISETSSKYCLQVDDPSFSKEYIPLSGQVSQFSNFILRAKHYDPVLSSDKGSKKRKSDGSVTAGHVRRRIVLVEDLPNAFHHNPSSLHSILARWSQSTNDPVPIVFIVSDSSSSSQSNIRYLFPATLQQDLGSWMQVIRFNSVAPTFLTKALKRILDGEGITLGRSQKSAIQSIVEESAGDLRSAVNKLQFELERKSRKSSSMSGSAKDSSLVLFHALGKILYGKRLDVADGASSNGRSVLPPHLQHHVRPPLRYDPEDVVERSHMTGSMFALFLHQNYLQFFDSLEALDRIAECFSSIDSLSNDWSTEDRRQSYVSSLSARTILFANDGSRATTSWTPLHKPALLDVEKKLRQRLPDVCSSFPSFASSHSTDEFVTDVIPYLPRLLGSTVPFAQLDFLMDIACFERRCCMKTTRLQDMDYVSRSDSSTSIEPSFLRMSKGERSDSVMETKITNYMNDIEIDDIN